MITSNGTMGTLKWTFSNGNLAISPISGNSGESTLDRVVGAFDGSQNFLYNHLKSTKEEMRDITSITFSGSCLFSYMRSQILGGDSLKQYDFPLRSVFNNGVDGFFCGCDNVNTLNVSGLNTEHIENFSFFFSGMPLVTLIGLSSISFNSATKLINMFSNTNLSSLDLSSLPLNNTNIDFNDIIDGMQYLTSVKFANTFNRVSPYSSSDTFNHDHLTIGLASYSNSATNSNGITIFDDNDFFSLPNAQKGTTWIRNFSEPSLQFIILETTRENNTALINFNYSSTSSFTANIYAKLTTDSGFSNTPLYSTVLIGSDMSTFSLALSSDDSYDFLIITSDGTNTIYSYTSIDSNIMLVEFTDDGDIKANGSIHASTVYADVGIEIDGVDVPTVDTCVGIRDLGLTNKNKLSLSYAGNESEIIIYASNGTAQDETAVDIITIPNKTIVVSNQVEGQDGSHNMGISWDGKRLLTKVDNEVFPKTIDLTLTNNFVAYEDNSGPKLYTDGHTVTIRGEVKPKASISGSSNKVVICNIPSEYAPKNHEIAQLCQGSGNAVWLCRIDINGVVSFSRYRNENASSGAFHSANTSIWLPFNITWVL